MKFEVYTDGSATVKTKPGGYGWVLVRDNQKVAEGSGYIPLASNNDAELEAAIQGLIAVYKEKNRLAQVCAAGGYDDDKNPARNAEVILVSDSQIILNWANGKNQFKQQDKFEKYNNLRRLVQHMNVKTRWVEGHSGDEHNERCDELANMARLQTTEKPKKNKKEPKQFRWNVKNGDESSKDMLKRIEIYADKLDIIREILLELMELEESRRK